MDVNTVNDMMLEAARAAREGDVDALCDLKDVAGGWCQMREAKHAQCEMIDALIELVENAEC